jgi:cysteinyl-tRNA synthetase
MNVRTKSIVTVGSLACLMVVVISVAILRGPIPLTKTTTLVISPIEQDGENGQIVTFTVTVTNTGTISDNYDLSVSDNAGWGLTLDSYLLEDVAPDGSQVTTLTVTIPGSAENCTYDRVTVIVTSRVDPKVSAENSCGVHVVAPTGRDYRREMKDFVQGISAYAKGSNPDFIIIPQNGHELLTENGEETGVPAMAYLNAIDGVGREDLFYGYYDDDVAIPVSEREYMLSFMDIAENNGIEVLVTDYCSTQSFVDDSYYQSAARGYISFAAEHRELDSIPEYPTNPYNANASNVTSLTEAKNFLYLINPGSFPNKDAYLDAIRGTNYDVVIVDLFYDSIALTVSEVASLKLKANGGARLVIAYMSIGEAENYRYYWQTEWETDPPSWLAEENPEWPGNYKVRYWDEDWQNIIYGRNDSYLKNILYVGFDGVYLDIIDAFEYFEA